MRLIRKILGSTKYTLFLCAGILLFTLVFKGSLFDFLKVRTISKQMTQEIKSIELHSYDLQKKLELVQDPKFIEKKIKEQLDYAKEGDLVFIFSSQPL